MKNIYVLLLIGLGFLGFSEAQAQKVVSGTITESSGSPLPGANVVIKGTTTGVVTDSEGRYTINVPGENTVLVFSFIGFATQEKTVGSDKNLNIVLSEDSQAIEEVVVVGYGVQKKVTVTGAVSSVKGSDLLKSPVPNLSSALTGRTSGVMTMQNSGQPGKDAVKIRVRGMGTLTDDSAGPLILVDGIERSFDQIDANEVESISVLKDASATAVYGIRGANGVIIVTTKKGSEGPAHVNYNGNFSIQTPTRLPKFLDGYNFARLFNEALLNDDPNSALIFTDTELQKFKDGSDPLFYPNTDWLDLCLKDHAYQTQHNINVNGGTKNVKYFVSLGYMNQGGLFKEFQEASHISNNNTYNRYNFRSNIDINVTPSTLVSFQLGGYSGLRNSSKGLEDTELGDSFFTGLLDSAPTATIGYYEGKVITLDRSGNRNVISALTNGFADTQTNDLNVNLGITQKLDFLLKGLQFRAKIAYDNNYYRRRAFERNMITYTPIRLEPVAPATEGEIVFRPNGEISDIVGDPKIVYGRGRQFYMDWGLEYNNSFGDHNVGALLLYNQKKRWYHGMSYPGVPIGYQDWVGRVTYNYLYKYLVEFSIGRNGSENFPKENRFGWFPAVSVGWIPTNETFIKNAIGTNVLSYMKLRASYGEVGNDKLGNARFMYFPAEYILPTSGSKGYGVLGEDPVKLYGYYEGKSGNPKVTWERAKKLDLAVDLRFFKDQLNFTFDYFTEDRNNILTARNTLPSYVAVVMQDAYNIGQVKNHGFEFEAGWNSNIGDFNYWVNGNYSFARNEIVFMDEAINLKYPNLNKTGLRVGEQFGYVFDGFFNTPEEVDKAPLYFGKKPALGDTKYADVTNDGEINQNDQKAIGYPRFPEVFYGFSAGFSYKGFDFNVLFQGAANASVFITDRLYKPFATFGSALDITENRWYADDPNKNVNASFPKLTVSYGSDQNYNNSTLNLKDASYIRLKNIELGYTFHVWKIESIRLFLSGQNLYTWDKLKIVDPEGTAGRGMQYPQMRVFNVGCRVNF